MTTRPMTESEFNAKAAEYLWAWRANQGDLTDERITQMSYWAAAHDYADAIDATPEPREPTEDTERLDWLDKMVNRGHLAFWDGPDLFAVEMQTTDKYANIREAIDAARAALSPATETAPTEDR